MSNDPFQVLLEIAAKDSTHTSNVYLCDSSGRYSLGPPKRPDIKHDNGHLDKFKRRDPTVEDRVQLAKWIGMLNAAEKICKERTAKLIDKCSGEDLSDGTAAYRHFLYGKGAKRYIDYERYLVGDPSGAKVLPFIIMDFVKRAEDIGKDRKKFSVTSRAYTIGLGLSDLPSPQTANWQKTIGDHRVWVSADVAVSATSAGEIEYTAIMTVHMEDMFNFNPGQKDIATGIPDSDNGRFEITGLGQQYINFGEVRRKLTWIEGKRAASQVKVELAPSTSGKNP